MKKILLICAIYIPIAAVLSLAFGWVACWAQTNTNAPATNADGKFVYTDSSGKRQEGVVGKGFSGIVESNPAPTNPPTPTLLPLDTNWVLKTEVKLDPQWVSVPYGTNVYQVQMTVSNTFLLSRYVKNGTEKIITNLIASEIVVTPTVPLRVREGVFAPDTNGVQRLVGYKP
jgi:hypothetical protein